VADQLKDEARCQDPDLSLALSVLSDAQPLVPLQYGSQQISIDEGDGGLSGAATDIARLVAILISQNDNPAFRRSTLNSMLSAGSALIAEGMACAGYGFDGLFAGPGNPPTGPLSSGQFYGQKGGEWVGCQSVIQFNGDWGFVMLWAGENHLTGWYPDFPAVMSIAETALLGQADLFPQFGMRSL
jgi:hypothetical protein